MNIEVKDIVVLDDDIEYGVVGKVVHKNKNYFHLINIKDNTKMLYCYQDKDELVEINDKELIDILRPLFLKSLNDKLSK